MMRIFFPRFQVAAALAALCFSAVAEGNLWEHRHGDEKMSLWSAFKNSQVFISKHEVRMTSKMKRKIGNPVEMIKDVEDEKRTLLSWVGVKDWTVKSYEWKEAKEGPELLLRGTYKDRKAQIISFIERHQYRTVAGVIVQEIYAEPVKVESAPLDKELSASFLQRKYP